MLRLAVGLAVLGSVVVPAAQSGLPAAAAAPPIVGIASDPEGGGWTVGSGGAVTPYGGAPGLGGLAGIPLARPVVGMAATPDGHGYWLVASDGGIFTFGDAGFYGSTGAIRLNKPIVGMAATPDGHGYWLVASDGGIFTFGDAPFYGSTGAIRLNKPIVGMASAGPGRGYWLVGSDGGIFSFDAPFFGSSPSAWAAVTGIASRDGRGYELASSTGPVTTFGNPAPAAAPPPPRLTPAPPPAAKVGAVQLGSSSEITVSWTYPSAGPASAEDAVVDLYQVVGGARLLAKRVGCVYGCVSYTFFYLQPGATYEADVETTLDAKPASELTTAPVKLADPCPGEVCVSVDATRPIGAADHAAQGFLHGAYAGADQTYLDALGATMYRGTVPYVNGQLDWSQWQAAESAGVPTTLVISDAWWDANSGHPPPPTPSGLAVYRQWLTTYIEAVLASGHRVDYFEPYNEPGDPNYMGPIVASTVTAEELYQQFLVAYQVIKGLDPAAKIIGPSQSQWSEWPDAKFVGGFNVTDFLNFAAANGIQLAALNFHFFEQTPMYLTDYVAEARQLAASIPQVGDPEVFVNEYGNQSTDRTPGWDVGFLAAVTDSGVSRAARSCFVDECWEPDLDGLLTSDGSQTLPDYWVRLFYASMSGDMVTTSSTQDSVASIASYDPSSGAVDVIVGRGVGCSDTSRCFGMPGRAAPVAVDTEVTLPWRSGTVTVTPTLIPGSSIVPTGQPTPQPAETVSVPSSGVISLPTPAFGDGDAWTYTITRS